ncbi:hypothetical protein LZ198_03875 [Myxococcus sp. K15C18031901]|uniref:hypothetical protein n=1 Tax=Myxococcus dinghuensis TaxID=2906761 RepID=UPI0020A7FCB6|nr:hypothetical protein [Myxococcus dinghuensis]MCP3098012.1 hypothetical protein [Myxococcus dinghuensis]
MVTARSSGSVGGSSVVRAEMRTALEAFLSEDDGRTDAAEHAYLAAKVADAGFLSGIEPAAQDYLFRYHELNDGVSVSAPLEVSTPGQTPAQLFGAAGRLADHAWVQEGGIPEDEGLANQGTLQWTYYGSFGPAPSNFRVVTLAELTAQLSSPVFGQAPTAAEVSGAVAYLAENVGTGARYYVASWSDPYGRTGPGDIGGYVVASVSDDRAYVRFIEVMTWSE